MAGLLPGYPAPAGNKRDVVVTIAGPSSYTVITTGATPTGGQSITAASVGMTEFDSVAPSMSDDGQYFVMPVFVGNPATPVTSVLMMWVTAAGGAEVAGTTNLSGRTFRLKATGY